MSERPQLIPPEMHGFGKPAGKFPLAFGRRFFLLLLIGLVWLGPAWTDPPFPFAILPSDFPL